MFTQLHEIETNELYKQEKEKREVNITVAVFVDVPVLVAKSPYSGTFSKQEWLKARLHGEFMPELRFQPRKAGSNLCPVSFVNKNECSFA